MGGPILVIEDDDNLRDIMRDWLETVFLDTDIIVAAHNNGGVPTAHTCGPCAILVDLDAIGSGALDAIDALQAAAPHARVIALAMDDHDALRDAVEHTGADCVRKSNMADQLLPMLRAIVGPEPNALAVDGRTKTVLCIEDELEMIKLIEYTLERGPFRVVGAVSGQQGLDMARKLQPDVILLDLMMPDLDGWEVARRFREDEQFVNVPIVAVTVVHPSSYPARELPVDDYVTKPFIPDELLRRVGEIARTVA